MRKGIEEKRNERKRGLRTEGEEGNRRMIEEGRTEGEERKSICIII